MTATMIVGRHRELEWIDALLGAAARLRAGPGCARAEGADRCAEGDPGLCVKSRPVSRKKTRDDSAAFAGDLAAGLCCGRPAGAGWIGGRHFRKRCDRCRVGGHATPGARGDLRCARAGRSLLRGRSEGHCGPGAQPTPRVRGALHACGCFGAGDRREAVPPCPEVGVRRCAGAARCRCSRDCAQPRDLRAPGADGVVRERAARPPARLHAVLAADGRERTPHGRARSRPREAEAHGPRHGDIRRQRSPLQRARCLGCIRSRAPCTVRDRRPHALDPGRRPRRARPAHDRSLRAAREAHVFRRRGEGRARHLGRDRRRHDRGRRPRPAHHGGEHGGRRRIRLRARRGLVEHDADGKAHRLGRSSSRPVRLVGCDLGRHDRRRGPR